MSNITILLGFVIGSLGFLFLLWKRLKEDYTDEKIFTTGFTITGFMLIGFLAGIFLETKFHASSIFNPHGIWFWLTFLFGSIGFALSYYKYKIRFFETLDAISLGFVFWFFSISLVNSPLISILTSLLIPLFFFINKRYKTFTWYKSGRVGIAGLLIFTIFFLIRLIVALISPNMIFFVGKFDAVISAIVSFSFFITLYKLSEV